MCRTLYDAKIVNIGYTTSMGAEEIRVLSRGMQQMGVHMVSVMSRYIEYHDICSAINNQQDGTGMTYEALAHAMVEIQLAPSIDIVRCGECKRFGDEGWCFWRDVAIKPDDFCSYGEREGE